MTKRELQVLRRAVDIIAKAYEDDDAYEEAVDLHGCQPDTCRGTLNDIIRFEESKNGITV